MNAAGTLRARPLRVVLRMVGLAGLVLVGTGCQSYHWRNDVMAAETDARESGKHLFVFYKWYLDSHSNRMLSETLSDPKVEKLFRDTVNVVLESGYPEFDAYVQRFGVHTYPATIILAPDGTYQVRLGFIPKDRFIAFVERAKQPRAPRGSRRVPPLQSP